MGRRCASGGNSNSEKRGIDRWAARVLSIVRVAVVLLVFAANAPRAVLLTPRTDPGRFTLGATELWFHRDAEWTNGLGASDDDYNLGAIWAKYGFHRRFTGFVEFAILNGDPHNEGTSYRHINLGVGVNVLFFEFEDFYVDGLVNYFENFQHDNDETNRHAMTRHWVAMLQIGKVFPLGSRHSLNAWWGPAYVKDEAIFDGGASPAARNISQDNFGAAAGTDFLFWEHVEVFTHVVFADHFQPRLGIGYRF